MSIHDDWPGTIAYPTAVTLYVSVGVRGGKLDTSLGATLMAAAELSKFHLAWENESEA